MSDTMTYTRLENIGRTVPPLVETLGGCEGLTVLLRAGPSGSDFYRLLSRIEVVPDVRRRCSDPRGDCVRTDRRDAKKLERL